LWLQRVGDDAIWCEGVVCCACDLETFEFERKNWGLDWGIGLWVTLIINSWTFVGCLGDQFVVLFFLGFIDRDYLFDKCLHVCCSKVYLWTLVLWWIRMTIRLRSSLLVGLACHWTWFSIKAMFLHFRNYISFWLVIFAHKRCKLTLEFLSLKFLLVKFKSLVIGWN